MRGEPSCPLDDLMERSLFSGNINTGDKILKRQNSTLPIIYTLSVLCLSFTAILAIFWHDQLMINLVYWLFIISVYQQNPSLWESMLSSCKVYLI